LLDDSQNLGIVDTVGPNLQLSPSTKTDEYVLGRSREIEKPVSNGDGAALFGERCASCHGLNGVGAGPPLAGIPSQGVGKVPHFHYSPGLAASDLKWSPELFFSFVTNPTAAFPTSAMKPVDLTRAEAQAIYRYLTSGETPKLSSLKESAPATASGEQSKLGSNALDPFLAQFAVEVERKVGPYEELVPGFWVGYDQTKDSTVYVHQKPARSAVGTKQARFSLSLDVADSDGSDWMSIERQFEASGKFSLSVAFAATLSNGGNAEIVLLVPRLGDSDARIKLGDVALANDPHIQEFTQAIDLDEVAGLDSSRKPRVVVFFPTERKFLAIVERFDITVVAKQPQ
jgi:cytochrome c